jgi:hypothetical protein
MNIGNELQKTGGVENLRLLELKLHHNEVVC